MENPGFAHKFECAVAARAIPGEEISGDSSLIRFHPEGALFAVIDGAGHGPEAASAAATAVSVLGTDPAAPLDSLLRLCHQELRSTRGAAISLASIRSSDLSMSWAGLGNVEVVLLRKEEYSQFKRETLLLRSGVAGYQFSPPRVSTLPINPGDILIFATDGVNSSFLEGISLEGPCQEVAESILNRHEKGTDDALVLVIRVVEGLA
jgi:serine phosphatase RsbU (regulator of sigma subunit)